MSTETEFSVALVTAPDDVTAKSIATSALKQRLCACVNILPGVESHYWWQGQLEQSREWLMVFKTGTRNLPGLEKHVLANHPYETPEFVAVPIQHGSADYLRWLQESIEPNENN